MDVINTSRPASGGAVRRSLATISTLVGSGDRIGALVLPIAAIGILLNLVEPSWFSVGGPPAWLKLASAILLMPGILVWLWSVALILAKVPRGELITTGPFAIVAHPLYTGVALLVLPWAGFLLDSWLGAFLGIALYVAARLFAPAEETALARSFGAAWDVYRARVFIPWL